MHKQRESGMGIGNFTIIHKYNWLGMAQQNHDSLTFRNRGDVRDRLIKPIILDMRKMRPREEGGLCTTRSESVSLILTVSSRPGLTRKENTRI